jgi:hypothetical protein
MQSRKFQWNRADTVNFFNKALIQTAPVILIYLAFVIEQIEDGFAWSDFVPNVLVRGTMVLYILNRVYDALQRLYKGK